MLCRSLLDRQAGRPSYIFPREPVGSGSPWAAGAHGQRELRRRTKVIAPGPPCRHASRMHRAPRFLLGNLLVAMVLIQLDGSWAWREVHHPIRSALAAATCFTLAAWLLLGEAGRGRAALLAPALAYLSIGTAGTLMQLTDGNAAGASLRDVLLGCLLNGWFVLQMTSAGAPALLWAAAWTAWHVPSRRNLTPRAGPGLSPQAD